MFGLGTVGIAAIAVAAIVIVAGLAILAFRSGLPGRRRGRQRTRSGLLDHPRVEVLETKVIDDERSLVLVRCDDIEHLIMIGGPADLVVENDVNKVRPPSQTSAPAQMLPGQAAASSPRIPPSTGASLEAAIAAAMPTPSEAPRRAARKPEEPRQPTLSPPPRPGLATVQPPRPAARGSETARPSSGDGGRRESMSPRRAPQAQPAPLQAGRASETRAQPSASAERQGRSGRGNNRGQEDSGLPAAQVPWVEPDSIESEIVEALRFEPRARSGEAPPARREPAAPQIDSSATLGDLADRLEEALAREMQGGGPAPRQEPEAGERTADAGAAENPEPEKPKRSAARDRQEKRERAESTKRDAGQSAEPEKREPEKREPAASPERREEAPVISLNARRREAADPLEDEMARLLGELTGDTKGR